MRYQLCERDNLIWTPCPGRRCPGRGQWARAIKEVGAGRRSLLDYNAASSMQRLRADTDRDGPVAGLPDQERRLLDLLCEGLTNRQIAERMFLAEKT